MAERLAWIQKREALVEALTLGNAELEAMAKQNVGRTAGLSPLPQPIFASGNDR